MKRATFSDIVQILEAELCDKEKEEYNELTEQYASMRELMEDPVTQLKRSSTLKSLQSRNVLAHENEQKIHTPRKNHDPKKKDMSYLKAVAVNDPDLVEELKKDLPSQMESDCDNSNIDGAAINKGDGISFVALQNKSDLNKQDRVELNNTTHGYVAFEEVAMVKRNPEEHKSFSDNIIDIIGEASGGNQESNDSCAAYVTVEIANK